MNLFSKMIKSALFIAVAFSALILLSSCGESERSVLWYQNEISGATVEVKTNKTEETFTMDISFGEEKTALITAPAEYSGIKFTIKDDKSLVSYYGKDYDMSESGLGSIEEVFAAFNIAEDQIAHLNKNDDGDTVIGALVQGGVYTVILNEEGLPKEINFDGSSVLRMKILRVNENNENPDSASSSDTTPSDSEEQ